MTKALELVNALIDDAAASMPGAFGIERRVERLKEAAAKHVGADGWGGHRLAPIYEALRTDPELARMMGVTVSVPKNSEDNKATLAIITRSSGKKGTPQFVLHELPGRRVCVLEFSDGANLIREAVNIEMKRQMLPSGR